MNNVSLDFEDICLEDGVCNYARLDLCTRQDRVCMCMEKGGFRVEDMIYACAYPKRVAVRKKRL